MAKMKADETYRKTEVLFCIDIKRDRMYAIGEGGWFSVFGIRENVAALHRRSRRLGLHRVTKKRKKKSDHVYAVTTTRRPKDILSVRNYGLHAERGSTKRLRGCRRDVAKVLTELSVGGGSIPRRESRQNFPAEPAHPAIRTIAMYRKANSRIKMGLYSRCRVVETCPTRSQ